MATPWVGRYVCKIPCAPVLGSRAQTRCCGITGTAQLVKEEGQTVLLCSEGVSMAVCLNSGSNLDGEMHTLQRHHALLAVADARTVIGDAMPKKLIGGLLLGKIINTLMAGVVGKPGDSNALAAVALA